MSRFAYTKKVNVGAMDKSLVLKKWIATEDTGGGQEGSYQTIVEGQIGEIRPVSANEAWKMAQMQQNASHIITMRYCPEQEPGMVWESEGKTYRIIGIVDMDDMHEFHRVTCELLTPKDK